MFVHHFKTFWFWTGFPLLCHQHWRTTEFKHLRHTVLWWLDLKLENCVCGCSFHAAIYINKDNMSLLWTLQSPHYPDRFRGVEYDCRVMCLSFSGSLPCGLDRRGLCYPSPISPFLLIASDSLSSTAAWRWVFFFFFTYSSKLFLSTPPFLKLSTGKLTWPRSKPNQL